MNEDYEDGIRMIDFGGPDEEEEEPPSRPRKRRTPVSESPPGSVRPYTYKGVRGGPLIAGYIK